MIKKPQISMDMTQGPLLGKIVVFALPLIASNILQLLFNAADVMVVGRYASYNSLAAVGSTSAIVYLFTNLLIGLAVGVNVVVAQCLGEGGREKDISNAIHTAIWMALVGGTILGLVGIVGCGWVLRAVQTPSDIYELTLTYLRIYFLGSPFVMLYNYGAAALRANGDTRNPLWYLLISGGVNLVLNLYFVVVLRWDVIGVALATILGQMLSAGLILRCLHRMEGPLHISWDRVRVDATMLKRMARIGIPAGIQSCLFSLSNVAIQSAINAYNTVIIAACSAGSSIESFLYITMNAFHLTAQTFVSQNMGAGKRERVSKVVRICLLATLVLGIVQSVATVTFAPQLIGLYNQDASVIAAGVFRLQCVASLYVIFGLSDVLVGSIRGAGYPLAPVIINLLGTCGLRLVWVALLDAKVHSVAWVYACYPVSWMVVLVALAIYWCGVRKKMLEEFVKNA